MPEESRDVVFISHNAVDEPYASALAQLIYRLAGNPDRIPVRFSTSKELGPEGGEAWRDWIYRQVCAARTTLIVVTPHAIDKPWLLWEAGAVKGAALARGTSGGQGSLIASLSYGLPGNECPDPLRGEQILSGRDTEALDPLFRDLLERHGLSSSEMYRAGKRMDAAFSEYVEAVDLAMRRAPTIVNEANVQDWLTRLDHLQRDQRLSELPGFERWLMLAFGREAEPVDPAAEAVIDLRLHRRLGELHLGQRQFRQAIRHLRLARRAAPRDIFILRPLAEATMKLALEGGAGNSPVDTAAVAELDRVLQDIVELDPQAYVASPDSAGLRAKYLRRVAGRPEDALDVYLKAFAANPKSYYLIDLAAQTQLELGQAAEAQASFRKALEVITSLGESNLWSHATAATACMGLADLEQARDHLKAMLTGTQPTPSQMTSILLGLREVGTRAGVDPQQLDAVLASIDGRSRQGS